MSGTLDENTKVADELKRLRAEHEVYTEQKSLWAFYLASYEGGPSFACKENLFRHRRETEDDFEDRAKRVHYLNYCAPLVDYFTDFVYNETIQRDGQTNSGFCTEFWKDVDKRGNDIGTFMRDISDEFQIFGTEYVLVDAPTKSVGAVISREQEKQSGIRPYLLRIRPQEIIDWVRDEFGNFVYVRRRQKYTELVGNQKKSIEKYTEWFKDHIVITIFDVSATQPVLLSRGELPNSIAEIPIIEVVFNLSKEDDETALSFLRDLSPQSREVMNLTSLLQEFLYRQCFNMLAMADDQSVPEQTKTEGESGTANVITYPVGANAPAYISPPVSPAQFLQEERQRIINEMYRIAAQGMVNELYNGVQSSGPSKAMSFSTTVPKIASRADILERAENEIMELVLLYMGKAWDGAIKYKDHYEITNLTDSLVQLTGLFRDLGMPSKTFAKQELKKLVHQFDGKFGPEELKTIEAEIDAAFASDEKFKKWIENIFNPQKPSPAAQNGPKSTGTTQEMMQESKTQTAATNKTRELQNKK